MKTMSAHEKQQQFLAQQTTERLRETVLALAARADAAREWQIARGAAETALRQRLMADLAEASSADLAGVLRAGMEAPSASRNRAERVELEAVEQIIRDRFPAADEAADDYLEGLDLAALPDDEYAHLRILLDAAGL